MRSLPIGFGRSEIGRAGIGTYLFLTSLILIC